MIWMQIICNILTHILTIISHDNFPHHNKYNKYASHIDRIALFYLIRQREPITHWQAKNYIQLTLNITILIFFLRRSPSHGDHWLCFCFPFSSPSKTTRYVFLPKSSSPSSSAFLTSSASWFSYFLNKHKYHMVLQHIWKISWSDCNGGLCESESSIHAFGTGEFDHLRPALTS